jgi:hypothetical protein
VEAVEVRIVEHALAALGFLALLCIIAFLIDHYTDGDRKLWREARYGCCP